MASRIRPCTRALLLFWARRYSRYCARADAVSSSGLFGVAPIDPAVSLTHGFASPIRKCPTGALRRMRPGRRAANASTPRRHSRHWVHGPCRSMDDRLNQGRAVLMISAMWLNSLSMSHKAGGMSPAYPAIVFRAVGCPASSSLGSRGRSSTQPLASRTLPRAAATLPGIGADSCLDRFRSLGEVSQIRCQVSSYEASLPQHHPSGHSMHQIVSPNPRKASAVPRNRMCRIHW